MNFDAHLRLDGNAESDLRTSICKYPSTRHRLKLVIALVVFMAGCASQPPRQVQYDALLDRAPAFNESLFGVPGHVPDFAEMTALTPQQESEFRRFFDAGVNSRHEPHKRVYEYLTRRLGNTRFLHRTLSASETVETRSGNCMSLALVTTAFARLADVDISWQLANADPVYSSEGSVIYSADHIQTLLFRTELTHNSMSVAFGRPYILVDYYTDYAPHSGEPLTESEMAALVYQNLAIEALAEGRLGQSFWLLRAGLQYDPANANIYNALAVVHRRAGDAQTAERLYRFALDEFGDQLIVLRNYRKLLLAQNRAEDADQLERRIMLLPDPDPYPLLGLGDEASENGDTGVALAYYQRAAEVAPYLHEVYLKIASIHTARGDLKRAQRALRKARDKAWAESDQDRYQAKLMALGER